MQGILDSLEVQCSWELRKAEGPIAPTIVA